MKLSEATVNAFKAEVKRIGAEHWEKRREKSFKDSSEDFKKSLVLAALSHSNVRSDAARLLGLNRSTLRSLMAQLRLETVVPKKGEQVCACGAIFKSYIGYSACPTCRRRRAT